MVCGQRGQAGFSLVEMMVAVALIFVVAGIAIPLYKDYTETSRQAAIINKAEQLRAFMDNWRLDNGSYPEGTYEPGGTNDFAATGFRVDSDKSDFSFDVQAGECGTLNDCYRLSVIKDGEVIGIYERGTGIWTWM